MKVSVVIPTYNRCKVVQRAIKSVLNQTHQDFEVLVIDDGSTDDTEQYFAQSTIDSRVRYVRLPANMGVHMARNRGIDEAHGEVVAFLDSDDEWFPNALEVLVAAYEKYPDVGFVGAPFRTPLGEITGIDCESGIIPFEDLLCERNQRRIKTGLPSLRRSVIGDDRWQVKYLQFIFFRLIQVRTQTYYHSEPLGIYYPNSDEITVTKARTKPSIELSIKRAEVLDHFLDVTRPYFRTHCPCNMSHSAYGAGMGFLLKGEKGKAVAFLSEAASTGKRFHYIGAWLFALLPFSSFLLRTLYLVKERRYARQKK